MGKKKLPDDLRRYHQCHDLVLGEIADDIKQKLPPSAGFLVDPKTTIVSPSTQPPQTCDQTLSGGRITQRSYGWCPELTVPFETGFKDVAEDLIHRAKQAGYNSHLITIEGSITRGPTHGRLLQTKARTRTHPD